MKTLHRSLLSWAAAGALCALSLVACGGDDDVVNPGDGGAGSGNSAGSGQPGAGSAGQAGGGQAGQGGQAGAPSGAVSVSGDITADTTWTRDNVYTLTSIVFVKAGATLTIEPGTVVRGAKVAAPGTALVVEQGAKLVARGTKDAPIVFTSAEPKRAPGDWGGVMLNGRAPVNVEGGKGKPEGLETGIEYGGDDPADSSGELSYVRIEFAGFLLSKDNELNALTLNAVGSGTTIDHVQVHFGTDDGVEWFGGTVNARYLLATGIQDDCFDWDFGWSGKAQFLACVQDDLLKGDNGIEADNNVDKTDAVPFSNPTLANVTLVGKSIAGAAGRGLLLRRGTKGAVHNALVTGFPGAGLDIDGSQTVANAQDGSLGVFSSIFAGAKNFAAGDDADVGTEGSADYKKGDKLDEAAWATDPARGNQEADAASLAISSTAIESVNLALGAGSPALTAGKPLTGDPFFTSVPFVGACGESCDDFAGWTAFPVE